jgi:DoxX-like family
MFIAYLIVTILTAAANIFSATLDFIRYKQVSINMAKAGVPESWMTLLGILKGAAAAGLLVGIGVPLVGAAAALGLICFFVAALITHLRARDYSFGLAVAFLVFAVVALTLRVDTSRDVASALLFR